MEWWILVPGALVAVAALSLAYAADSRSARRRQTILHTAPVRPGVSVDAPTYVFPEQVRSASGGKAPLLSDSQHGDIDRARQEITPVAAGFTSPDFITDPTSSSAVLIRPVVVVADQINAGADLAALIGLARPTPHTDQPPRPLVLVARSIAEEISGTCAINAAAGRLACLCVTVDDPAAIAAQVQAEVLQADDVTAGYLPEAALGSCELWISDARHSWIVPDGMWPSH